MAKRKHEEIDVNKIKELEDIARGVEGSQGFVTINSELADIYEKLGGNMDDVAETGAGAIEVPCEDLCDCMFEEPEVDEATGKKPRGKHKREANEPPRMAPRPQGRSRLEKKLGERVTRDSDSVGRVHRETTKPEAAEASTVPAGEGDKPKK